MRSISKRRYFYNIIAEESNTFNARKEKRTQQEHWYHPFCLTFMRRQTLYIPECWYPQFKQQEKVRIFGIIPKIRTFVGPSGGSRTHGLMDPKPVVYLSERVISYHLVSFRTLAAQCIQRFFTEKTSNPLGRLTSQFFRFC